MNALQRRLFMAALDELGTIGEPVNRVLELDLDGDEVTLALYDLPRGEHPANAHRHRAGPQLSSAQNQGGRMSDPAKALQMLDLMEKFFDGGRRWTKGMMSDIRGNRCLLGAMEHIRATAKIDGDGTEFYFKQALPSKYPVIPAFNDTAKSYAPIAKLIGQARALAQKDLVEKQRRQAEARRLQMSSRARRERAVCCTEGFVPIASIPAIPLAVLKYLSPERLAELRATAPGLGPTLDRIERERQRQATIESLKKSVAEAAKGRERELVA